MPASGLLPVPRAGVPGRWLRPSPRHLAVGVAAGCGGPGLDEAEPGGRPESPALPCPNAEMLGPSESAAPLACAPCMDGTGYREEEARASLQLPACRRRRPLAGGDGVSVSLPWLDVTGALSTGPLLDAPFSPEPGPRAAESTVVGFEWSRCLQLVWTDLAPSEAPVGVQELPAGSVRAGGMGRGGQRESLGPCPGVHAYESAPESAPGQRRSRPHPPSRGALVSLDLHGRAWGPGLHPLAWATGNRWWRGPAVHAVADKWCLGVGRRRWLPRRAVAAGSVPPSRPGPQRLSPQAGWAHPCDAAGYSMDGDDEFFDAVSGLAPAEGLSEAPPRVLGVTAADPDASNGVGPAGERPPRENGLQKHRWPPRSAQPGLGGGAVGFPQLLGSPRSVGCRPASLGLRGSSLPQGLGRERLGAAPLTPPPHRTALPAPMFTRGDFSMWSVLKKCIGLVRHGSRGRSPGLPPAPPDPPAQPRHAQPQPSSSGHWLCPAHAARCLRCPVLRLRLLGLCPARGAHSLLLGRQRLPVRGPPVPEQRRVHFLLRPLRTEPRCPPPATAAGPQGRAPGPGRHAPHPPPWPLRPPTRTSPLGVPAALPAQHWGLGDWGLGRAT
ncbi:hypothetical protein J0S82_018644 [Galemys pyrenaicus]|uniref:Uncharacterized protein n=1 Tax=Galemys pyrenaicus TaxID=202257 RepID=A0A8J6A6T3_GALPY|nr:hypothetical protein J0S82_018644 [Galemys pyrenaicus]